MTKTGWLVGLVAGLLLGAGGGFYLASPRPVEAGNDRHEQYIICTGAVTVTPRSPSDGVWVLDYRAGKLLGTVIDRDMGKIIGWAEVDLVTEFGIPPRHNANFLMTTGQVGQTQAALYLAETTSGKIGVYTMGPRPDNQVGVVINRHDLVMFRKPAKPAP